MATCRIADGPASSRLARRERQLPVHLMIKIQTSLENFGRQFEITICAMEEARRDLPNEDTFAGLPLNMVAFAAKGARSLALRTKACRVDLS